jgi:zinc ribbon protein
MSRFCANCGTEVEDLAVFCPTCGQPIDQASETEIPAAPAWPDQLPDEAERPAPVTAAEPSHWEEATRTETAPPPPPALAAGPPPQPAHRPGPPPVKLPLTMPVTLSAWLIGGGAALAALGVLIGLFGGFVNPIDLILLILFIGIAATVFLSASLPAIPQLRLITLVIVLIGFGTALDRIGFGSAGVGELLLFLGTAAAAIGAIILELGRDQPLGGPQP